MIIKIYTYNGIVSCSLNDGKIYIDKKDIGNIHDISINIFCSDRIIGATGLFRLPFDFFSYWYKVTIKLDDDIKIFYLIQNTKSKKFLTKLVKLIDEPNPRINLYNLDKKKRMFLKEEKINDVNFIGLENSGFCELGIKTGGENYQILDMSLYYYIKFNLLFPSILISVNKAYSSPKNIIVIENNLKEDDIGILNYLYFNICRKYMRIIGNSIFLPILIIFTILLVLSVIIDGHIDNELLIVTFIWAIIYGLIYLLYRLILFGIRKFMKSTLHYKK